MVPKMSYNVVIPEVVIGNPFFYKNLDTRLRGYDGEGSQIFIVFCKQIARTSRND
jgi:hypothetical protein